jgi:hypothetical protein
MYGVPGAEENGRKATPEKADGAAASRLGRPANDVGGRIHLYGQYDSDAVVFLASLHGFKRIYIHLYTTRLILSLLAGRRVGAQLHMWLSKQSWATYHGATLEGPRSTAAAVANYCGSARSSDVKHKGKRGRHILICIAREQSEMMNA